MSRQISSGSEFGSVASGGDELRDAHPTVPTAVSSSSAMIVESSGRSVRPRAWAAKSVALHRCGTHRARAPLCRRMNSRSRGPSVVTSGRTAPPHNQIATIAVRLRGDVGDWTATTSPGPMPRSIRPRAIRRASATICERVRDTRLSAAAKTTVPSAVSSSQNAADRSVSPNQPSAYQRSRRAAWSLTGFPPFTMANKVSFIVPVR